MSKPALAALGWILAAAVGFGLGRYAGSSSDTADATPPRGGAAPDSIEEVLRDPDPFSRAARLATLLPVLGPEAVPEARAAIATLTTELPAMETVLLMRFWATHEPEEAARFSATMGSGYATLYPAVELWATTDPEAAAQWVRWTNAGPAEIALVRGWFASGRPGLEDYIRDLGMGGGRQRALGALAGAMIQRDGPEAAMRWAEALPDENEPYKREAFTRVARELAKVDAAAAVAWCEAHCDRPFGANIRTNVAARWAARDGPAALQWLSTEPASRDRDLAVKDAWRAWRRVDPEGLSRWVEAMGLDGVEPWFQPAVAMYARFHSRTEPAEAMEWAALVENEKRRETLFIEIARRWHQQDPAAAEAWLGQSPLSEQARAKAREAPPRRTRRRQAPADPAAGSEGESAG